MGGLTIENPVTLSQALSSGRVIPGDVLRLRGGTYVGDYKVFWKGTSANKIQIRPYQNEPVRIDGSIDLNDYVEMYDIEVMNSSTNRIGRGKSVRVSYPGAGVYGCYIHDLPDSGVNFFNSGSAEVCENVISNNGYIDPQDESGHGHAIYSYNNLGGLRSISRNLLFDQLGRYSIHLYSELDYLIQDYLIEDNIIANENVHVGGGLGLKNILYRHNVHYNVYSQFGRYVRPTGRNYDLSIIGNRYIDSSIYVTDDFDDLVEVDNLVWSNSWARTTGYLIEPKPATWSRWIAFSKSDRWLGSLTIYNRDSADIVPYDFNAKLPPGSYRLRNAQNMAQSWVFDYVAGSVNIPMKGWTCATQIGGGTPPATYPVFGTFIIEHNTLHDRQWLPIITTG